MFRVSPGDAWLLELVLLSSSVAAANSSDPRLDAAAFGCPAEAKEKRRRVERRCLTTASGVSVQNLVDACRCIRRAAVHRIRAEADSACWFLHCCSSAGGEEKK